MRPAHGSQNGTRRGVRRRTSESGQRGPNKGLHDALHSSGERTSEGNGDGGTKGTRRYEMLATRVQEISNGLGIAEEPDAAQPQTYAETAGQTEVMSQNEDPEDQPQYMYSAEDMKRERQESREWCERIARYGKREAEETTKVKIMDEDDSGGDDYCIQDKIGGDVESFISLCSKTPIRL